MTNTTNTTKNDVTMLNINFFAKNISDDMKKDFMTAIAYERDSMKLDDINENISSLAKKIANKDGNYTDTEVSVFKAQLEKAESEKSDIEKTMSDCEPVYTKVFAELTKKDESSHMGNKKEVVRTVLRILGNWDNERALKSAVIPALDVPELYQALETIHVNSSVNEDGGISLTKEVKEAYKTASKELESIIKKLFSLSCATAYTCAMRVKLNAYDKKILHDCYVKSFKNEFAITENGVDWKSRKYNTLVTSKTNKKTGKVTYNYSSLAGVIAQIVLKHYFVTND